MIALSAEEIAAAVGGSVVGVRSAEAPAAVVDVFIDSRDVRPGGLFACIRGERVDGHDFVSQASDRGATLMLATRPVDAPAVIVDDVVDALGRLASYVLRRLPDLRVVGITGSSGKTTTKDLVAAFAGGVGPMIAPVGSFNTEVGLPLTVLRSDESTRVLVLEMGARGVGHIAYLCGIARPDIAVVLNVGTAHLGEFGSVDAVATAKGELVEGLNPEGVALLNSDDSRVAAMANRTAARVVSFGEGRAAAVRASDARVGADGRASFVLDVAGESADVALRLVGRHQVSNALAAAAVGLELGLDVPGVAAALSEAEPASAWRMEVTTRPDGLTVINDAYNANPESMLAALRSLVDMAGTRRTWAVLGPMRELGIAHDDKHTAIGQWVARSGIDRLVVVGEQARPMIEAAVLEGSSGMTADLVPDADAAVALLRQDTTAHDLVLVKASRAEGLERVAAALLADPAGGSA